MPHEVRERQRCPIPALPFVIENDHTKKLVGIATDRDLALKVVADGRDPKSTKVEKVMTRKVVTCRPEDDLQKALDAMSEHQLRRIPVVDDDNKLVGIIWGNPSAGPRPSGTSGRIRGFCPRDQSSERSDGVGFFKSTLDINRDFSRHFLPTRVKSYRI